MNLLIIKSNNKRNRYKFVTDVCDAVQVQTTVLGGEGYLKDLRDYWSMRNDQKFTHAILIGASSYFFWHFILVKLFHRMPVCIRIGGDPLESRADRIRRLRHDHHYIRMIKTAIDSWFAWFLIRRADICITVSEALARHMKDRYRIDSTISIPRSMDTRKSNVRHISPDEPLRLLTVVNLDYREKAEGILRLLHAFSSQTFGAHHSYVWRIVGGGLHASEVKKAVEQFKHSSVLVDFVGYSENVEDHYRWADVFLYSSHLDWMPNVLLEAKSYGLPVVLENYPPLHEIFSSGGAMQFDFTSPKSLKDALEKVGHRKDTRILMCEQNIKDISTRFCSQIIGKKLAENLSHLKH